MLIAIINNDNSIRIGHYKTMFPNVSFPSSGPSNEFLAKNNAKQISYFKTYDRETQKLVSCEPYVEGNFVYMVEVQNKTADDTNKELLILEGSVRQRRNALLVESDWTQISDVPVDKQAWATYRQALRDLPNNPNWPNVEMPTKPTE